MKHSFTGRLKCRPVVFESKKRGVLRHTPLVLALLCSEKGGKWLQAHINWRKGLGKIGYVANSPYTVLGESMSAGRMYDLFKKKAKGKVILVTEKGALCELKKG